jgi:formylmethanofuran dehydrogenase subunit E
MKSPILLFCLLVFNYSIAQNNTIKVLDTDFSKGRLTKLQTITLEDVSKFHGHLCDGLVVGFLGLKEVVYKLFPDSIADRTNIRIVSKSSPCLTDIAIYLSGGRYQFNTFYVSDSIEFIYVVQRIDNGNTYGVKLKPGIKPHSIDSLGNLANQGKSTACVIDTLHEMENKFLYQLLLAKPSEIFIVEAIPHYSWKPSLTNTFIKTDILNKNLKSCETVIH